MTGSPVKPCASLLAALVVLAAPAQAFEPVAILTGVATAKDGDGVLFGRVEIRLQGVAAPEYNSRRKDEGGQEAYEALASLVDGHEVRCELDGTTAVKRPVGICYLGGEDLGAVLVQNGFARDCPRYSQGRYRAAEQGARQHGRDLSAIYPLPDYC